MITDFLLVASAPLASLGAVVQDYELLPALDKLVTFGDSSTNALNKPFGPQHLQRGPKETSLIQNMRRSKVQSMPVFVKQVVAQEVKMEAVKRNHEENSHQAGGNVDLCGTSWVSS